MKHKEDCKMVFGRKDATCPRCQELLAGAAPRDGWQASYYKNKASEESRTSRAISQHFASEEHKKETMCTAFDW